VFVWGDSLAAHFSYGLIATDRNIHLDGETSANCIPFLSVHDIGNADCQGNNETALEAISKLKPQVVVLFAEWRRAQTRGYDVPAEIKKTISAITKLGVRTLVIGPSLEWSPALPQKLLQAYFKLGSIPVRMTDNSQGPGRDLDRRLSNALLGTSASYFSVYNLWCDKADCETVIKEGDRMDMIAYDTAHLTIPAAKQLANAAFDSFHFVDVISSVKKLEVTR
jgi:hypothetical protein